MTLKNNSLLQHKTLINGKWVAADDGKTFAVPALARNPLLTKAR